MTTQQQLASNVLPSLSDCRRALDRVEMGVEIALAAERRPARLGDRPRNVRRHALERPPPRLRCRI